MRALFPRTRRHRGSPAIGTPGQEAIAACSAAFSIESSVETGRGITGSLQVAPAIVGAGEPSSARFTVLRGHAPIADLDGEILLVDPDRGAMIQTLASTTSLDVGATFAGTRVLVTMAWSWEPTS